MGYYYSMNINARLKPSLTESFIKIAHAYFNMDPVLDKEGVILRLEHCGGIRLKSDNETNVLFIENIETEHYEDIVEFFDLASYCFKENSFIEFEHPEDNEYKKLIFTNSRLLEVDGSPVVVWENPIVWELNDYFHIKDRCDTEIVHEVLKQLDIEYVSDNSSLNLLKDEIVESRLKYGFDIYTQEGKKVEITEEFVNSIKNELQDSCDSFFKFSSFDDMLVGSLYSKDYILK